MYYERFHPSVEDFRRALFCAVPVTVTLTASKYGKPLSAGFYLNCLALNVGYCLTEKKN